MNNYDSQKWFNLYKTALLELERAALTGRIADARAEITLRLETLQQHPDLHHAEMSAIQDALNNLRVLEREEQRMGTTIPSTIRLAPKPVPNPKKSIRPPL